jgi:hypothetical protein
MLTHEYRQIPETDGEVGGDEIYLGTPTHDNGKRLDKKLPTDDSVGAGDGLEADDSYTDGAGRRYAFVGWNVTSEDPQFVGYAIADLALSFTAATAANTTATAWYVPVTAGPPGPAHVACYGLDRTVNRFFRSPPIERTTPGSAWADDPSRVVKTAETAVSIEARQTMNGHTRERVSVRISTRAAFSQWALRAQTSTGALPVPAGRGGVALAYCDQRVEITEILTIPSFLIELIRGRLDLETIREHYRTPVSDPDWKELAPSALDAALRGGRRSTCGSCTRSRARPVDARS